MALGAQDDNLAEYNGEALRPHRLSWFERKFVHPGAKPMSRSSSNANMYGAADEAEAGVTEVLRKSPTTV